MWGGCWWKPWTWFKFYRLIEEMEMLEIWILPENQTGNKPQNKN